MNLRVLFIMLLFGLASGCTYLVLELTFEFGYANGRDECNVKP